MAWEQPLDLKCNQNKEDDCGRTEIILGDEVEVVDRYTYLGVHLENRLDQNAKGQIRLKLFNVCKVQEVLSTVHSLGCCDT